MEYGLKAQHINELVERVWDIKFNGADAQEQIESWLEYIPKVSDENTDPDQMFRDYWKQAEEEYEKETK